MMAPVLAALANASGPVSPAALAQLVTLPRGVDPSKRADAVEHTVQYLVAGEFATRQGGMLLLTATGRSMAAKASRGNLTRIDIEEIMRPGHIHWYGKPYRISNDAGL